MTGRDIMRGIRALFGGLFAGLLVVALATAVIIVLTSLVRADEEIHYHSDFELGIIADDNLEDLFVVLEIEKAIQDLLAAERAIDCVIVNRTNQYRIDKILVEIERYPELAYIYEPTLKILRESWCTE